MTDRSRLRWSGPPSQRLALAALRAGRIPLVVGALVGIGALDRDLLAAGSVIAALLLIAALIVERRERRGEDRSNGSAISREDNP